MKNIIQFNSIDAGANPLFKKKRVEFGMLIDFLQLWQFFFLFDAWIYAVCL